MLERTLIWLGFVLVVLVFCWWRPNATRIFMGFFFIVMAIGVHVVLVLAAPTVYLAWGQSALLAPYRWLFSTVVAWNPVVFGLLAATFENRGGVADARQGALCAAGAACRQRIFACDQPAWHRHAAQYPACWWAGLLGHEAL